MSDSFFGRGWSFPIGIDPDGQIKMAEAEHSIQHSIWAILGTSPGERMMRPDFGCGLQDLVFAANSASTAGLATEAVRRALARWEPRITVLDVHAVFDRTQPNRLLIEINYEVRATNSRANLVYPFYIEHGQY